jgi:hypothetical protein
MNTENLLIRAALKTVQLKNEMKHFRIILFIIVCIIVIINIDTEHNTQQSQNAEARRR